jgi:hypothetical protein
VEEVIDFDSWIEQYSPPEVEFWAIYNPDTSAVVGIYPSPAADEKKHKIKIERELAEDIQNGIIRMSSCFVDLDAEVIEIVEKHSLTKIDDILHRLVDKKYSSVQDPDIVVKYNEEDHKLTFVMTPILKTRKIRWDGHTEVEFLITSYNDPHCLYQVISFKLEELEESPREFIYNGVDQRFSIFTRRIFKNYVFEKV